MTPDEVERDVNEYLIAVRRVFMEQCGCIKPIALDISVSHLLMENAINLDIKVRYGILLPPEPDATVKGGSP